MKQAVFLCAAFFALLISSGVLAGELEVKLNVAVMDGREEVVRELLKKGADVNTKGYKNITPLMFAAQYGHDNIVRILIDNGADVNAKDNEGMTALMYAIRNDKKQVVRTLNGDINAAEKALIRLHKSQLENAATIITLGPGKYGKAIWLKVLKGNYKLTGGDILREGSSLGVNENWLNFPSDLAIKIVDGQVNLKGITYSAGTELIVNNGQLVER